MDETPNLFDAAPGLYEACVAKAENGHTDTCKTALTGDMTDCTCGQRSALKAVAYARGDDVLEVDEEKYEV